MWLQLFSQTEYNNTKAASKKVKSLLAVSYTLKVGALVFLFFVLKSPWYFAGFAAVYGFGIIFRQSVLEMTASYEYFFAQDKLIISKFSNFGKKKVLLTVDLTQKIVFGDAIDADKVEKIKAENKHNKTGNRTAIFAVPDGLGCLSVTINQNTADTTLYFCPSDYLRALIEVKNKVKASD